MEIRKHFDVPSLAVLVITFVLFSIALFVKGFAHDLLLEAGVFLVSVKLIMMAYKISISTEQTRDQLRELSAGVQRIAAQSLSRGPEGSS